MEYDVIYSDRKTISLSLKDGRLTVRAPRRTSRARIEEVIRSHAAWIEKHVKRQKERAERIPELTEEQIADLRKRARILLTARTEYFSKIMGLKYGRITITGAKTRFGSCNSKGNIAYSYRLMFYSEEAIDYVVVHELAHLVEMNHSPRFYAIVSKYLPDYKRRAAMLKN